MAFLVPAIREWWRLGAMVLGNTFGGSVGQSDTVRQDVCRTGVGVVFLYYVEGTTPSSGCLKKKKQC